ncbi:MAG: YkgJ family cysteine cluster protein [Myxococcaceae bacterium]|nr:YkgJ family cysteine cluster protein [Myxococcaceae bacterium]
MTGPGSVCARCPKLLGASCCEVKPGEHLATLTRADVARIRDHLRRAAHTFVDEEVLSDAEVRDYEARRPLYRGYFRRGPVRWTLRQHDGACVFHDRARGCVLPVEVRPLACRLYPFEQFPDGSWSVQMGRHGDIAAAQRAGGACLAVEEATDMDEVLAAFGTTRDEVERLGAELAEAVSEHGRGRER